MEPFIGKDFLLDTGAARELFHGHADGLPIFDYHCHLQPREISENRPFSDIAEIWLKGDHYKWRIMRANGAGEELCSGGADWGDKFEAYAAALERSAGNPLLHWSHLELQRAYGIDDVLTAGNARKIREKANAVIRERGDTPRSMFERFNVAVVCTTDDPADDLRWHKAIDADAVYGLGAMAAGRKTARIYPAFRPDKAMNAADAAAWKDYAKVLGEAAGVEIRTFADLCEALSRRHAFFHSQGCRISDHALLVPPFAPCAQAELDAIVSGLLAGRQASAAGREKFATAVLAHCGRLNAESGWTMQLHIGALRNVNRRFFGVYGPDGGWDTISDAEIVRPLASFLDMLDSEGALPKTILYSLDGTKHTSLAALAQCYAGRPAGDTGGAAVPGKMQYGAAWWFQDHLDGMDRHLVESASVGVIGRWVGMLTDSRSFLSYPRHEYFRRILCARIGRWVESGELPAGDAYAASLVRNISWFNACEYFGMELPAWSKAASGR